MAKLISISLFIGACVSAFAALAFALGLAMIPHTVENGDVINAAFAFASRFVEGFHSGYGRLPSQAELDAWNALPPQAGMRVSNIRLLPASERAAGGGGSLDTGGCDYRLALWRGEWDKYYSPKSKSSTVDSAAGLYGSSIRLSVVFASSSFALFTLCRRARRARKWPDNS